LKDKDRNIHRAFKLRVFLSLNIDNISFMLLTNRAKSLKKIFFASPRR